MRQSYARHTSNTRRARTNATTSPYLYPITQIQEEERCIYKFSTNTLNVEDIGGEVGGDNRVKASSG